MRQAVLRTLGFVVAILGCLTQGMAQNEHSDEIQPRMDLVSVKYDRAGPALAAPSASSAMPKSLTLAESSEAELQAGSEERKPLPYLELLLTFSLIVMTIFMARSTLRAEGVQALSRISALFIAQSRGPASAKRKSIVQSGIQRIRQTFGSGTGKKS